MADRVLEWMLYIGSEYMLDRIVEWSLMGVIGSENMLDRIVEWSLMGVTREIYRNGEGKKNYKKKIK